MLKIKDNVDLKELEKFGLKKQPKPYTGYYICIARGIKSLMVCPDEGNREIIVDKWHDNDPRVHKKANCKYRSNKQVYDVLYDLIKADLVEKVEEGVEE